MVDGGIIKDRGPDDQEDFRFAADIFKAPRPGYLGPESARLLSPEQVLKYEKLKIVLASMGTICVALSGGINSALLLAAAVEVAGEDVVAATGISRAFPEQEVDTAIYTCELWGVQQLLIDSSAVVPADFHCVKRDLCYLCKHELFDAINRSAAGSGYGDATIVEGSSTDELGNFRPGRCAMEAIGVRSPLVQARFSKTDVRAIGRALGLSMADSPSFACLSATSDMKPVLT